VFGFQTEGLYKQDISHVMQTALDRTADVQLFITTAGRVESSRWTPLDGDQLECRGHSTVTTDQRP